MTTTCLSRLTSILVLGILVGSGVSKGDDSDAFFSTAAQLARSSGSPVGPTQRIIICHKGRTISVAESAVPAHLRQGDTLGPCPNDVVICHDGKITRVINEKHLSGHLAHGDTLGPCPNQVFMCNSRGRTIVVRGERVDAHLARGFTLGLCSGEQLLCHKGKTIKVNDSAVPAHLAHGDYVGYCLGAPGPVISTNSLPPQISQ